MYPQVLEVIKTVQAQVRWKPDNAIHHLQKRKLREHLPSTATLEDYERIISTVLHDKSARVYHYWYNRVAYVTVVTEIGLLGEVDHEL